jgi:hypothetical protein
MYLGTVCFYQILCHLYLLACGPFLHQLTHLGYRKRNWRSTNSMPPDGAAITSFLFHNFLFRPWRWSRNFAAPIFLLQDGFWELVETPPTGLFSQSLLVALIVTLLLHTSFWINLPFWVRLERDRMPRHIVCSWRCLVTILGLQLVLYLHSIWTAFVYRFNSCIKDISPLLALITYSLWELLS